tara:strand:- start:29011 stop:30309 length:1299 start_codon:yes stop_codon:yes gene_type:complete
MGIRVYILFFLSISLFSKSISQVDNNFRFKSTLDKAKHVTFKNNHKSKYQISLLLPFCLDHNTFILSNSLDSLMDVNVDDYDLYKKTKISLDFYLGFLLSLNAFKSIDIDISVFDIKEGLESKEILANIVREGYLEDMDLIIGPLFTDNFVFFKDRFDSGIPIISPFSKKAHITDGNENVIQLATHMKNHLSFFSQYIFDHHVDDNLLLIRRDTILKVTSQKIAGLNEWELKTDTLIPSDIDYGQIVLNGVDTSLFSFKEIKVLSNVIDSIHHELDTLGMKNVIIIPSDDNVFVADLLSKLHACRDTNMVVYGMPTLSNFNHISVYDLMDMNVTFPHNQFFNNAELSNFIINFYDHYNYSPHLKYASAGYELGLYFIDFFWQDGSSISDLVNSDPRTILGTTYDFKQSKNGGYKNVATLIFQYDDFNCKRID